MRNKIKLNVAFLFGLLMVNFAFAQEKAVTFSTEKEGKYIVFKAKNTSEIPQKVTIELTKAEGLRDNKRPFSKLVAPNSEIVLKKVLISGEKYSYSYNHRYEVSERYKKAQSVKVEKAKEAAALALENEFNINSGIVVFNQDSCPRCNRTTNYLVENDIDFTLIDIENNKKNNQFMWQYLKKKGITGKIVTPVVVVDGVVSHSHEDLMRFLKALDQ